MPQVSWPESLARRARAAPARAGGCRIVAVDGPSAAGKSTLARAIAARLGAQVVHLDDLLPGWHGLRAGPAITLRDIVQPIARGEGGGFRRYDWIAGEYAEWCEVPHAPYLVLDGCGSGIRTLAPYLSLLVWVDAPQALRFERGIARDGEAYLPHWTAWEEETRALFGEEDTAARADVVVDGTGAGWDATDPAVASD
jgi:hypothetical protein